MWLIKLLKDNRGFSLLEVAIAITVIGVLAAVVLKGQSLVGEAKLQATATQIRQYTVAVEMFRDKYQAIPGDYHFARENISPSLEDGDGNSEINSEIESLSFWKHLKSGGFISLKEDFPKSKLGGSFIPTSRIYGRNGTWIVFSNSSVSEVLSGFFRGVVTPKQARDLMVKLDSKVDNDITVVNGESCKGGCVSGGKYNLESEEKSCVILIKVD